MSNAIRASRWGVIASLLLAVTGVSAPAVAQDKSWKNSDLGQTMFGPAWLGAEIDKKALENKVVLLDFWGYDVKQTHKFITHLSGLNKKYHKYGLVVIGAHARGPAEEEAVKIAKARGANYPIIAAARIPALNLTRLPVSVLFGPDGKIAWHDNATSKKTTLEKNIVELLKKVKSEAQLAREARAKKIFAGREYDKVPRAAAAVKAGQLGRAYKYCEPYAKKEDERGEQATSLMAAIESLANEMLDKVDRNKTESPVKAFAMVQEMQKVFAGTDFAKTASELLRDMMKDKEFQASMKAEKEYLVIAGAVAKLPPRPDTLQKLEAWQKANKTAITLITRRADLFKKKYPDSRFTAKLNEALKKLE
jgi:hypothetical protein